MHTYKVSCVLTNDGLNRGPFVTRARNKFLFCIMVQIVYALVTDSHFLTFSVPEIAIFLTSFRS